MANPTGRNDSSFVIHGKDLGHIKEIITTLSIEGSPLYGNRDYYSQTRCQFENVYCSYKYEKSEGQIHFISKGGTLNTGWNI